MSNENVKDEIPSEGKTIKKKKKKDDKLKKSDKTKKTENIKVFDPINANLKKKFGVNHIDYITNNGIIKNGWLVSNKDGLSEIIKILSHQKAPVFILGSKAGALFKWSISRSMIVQGELWVEQKLIDSFECLFLDEKDVIQQYADDWYTQVGLD